MWDLPKKLRTNRWLWCLLAYQGRHWPLGVLIPGAPLCSSFPATILNLSSLGLPFPSPCFLFLHNPALLLFPPSFALFALWVLCTWLLVIVPHPTPPYSPPLSGSVWTLLDASSHTLPHIYNTNLLNGTLELPYPHFIHDGTQVSALALQALD